MEILASRGFLWRDIDIIQHNPRILSQYIFTIKQNVEVQTSAFPHAQMGSGFKSRPRDQVFLILLNPPKHMLKYLLEIARVGITP